MPNAQDGWETKLETSEQIGIKNGGSLGQNHCRNGNGGQRSNRSSLSRPLWEFDSDMDSDEMYEHHRNNVYSEGNVAELLSQGIKPWDDDAEDALGFLNGDSDIEGYDSDDYDDDDLLY